MSMSGDNGNSDSGGSGGSSDAPNSILGGQRVSKGGRRDNSDSNSNSSDE